MTAADDRKVTPEPIDLDQLAKLAAIVHLQNSVEGGDVGALTLAIHVQAMLQAESASVERGYRRAVDRLRDGDAFAEWKLRQPARSLYASPVYVLHNDAHDAGDYLEAVDQDADSARQETPGTAQPRVWVLPTIPEDVKAVRDAEGFVWKRVLDVDNGVWRRSTGAWTGDIVQTMIRNPSLGPLTEVPDA